MEPNIHSGLLAGKMLYMAQPLGSLVVCIFCILFIECIQDGLLEYLFNILGTGIRCEG